MPDWEKEVRHRLEGLRLSPTREREIADEWAQHLEDRYAELRAEGLREGEAVRVVLSELDEDPAMVPALRRTIRREPPRPVPPGGGPRHGVASGLLQDVRFAARTLRLNPGFTLAAGLTLALGIGALTAIFSVVDGVLLRPLPYADADGVVRLFEGDRNSETTREGFSAPDLYDLRERARTLEQIAAYQTQPRSLSGEAGAERVTVTAASHELFSLLGIAPAAGRTYEAAEDAPGGEPVALLSEDYWRRRFNADPDLLGSTVRLDDIPHTVIGVMPASFAYPSAETEIWVPLRATPTSSPRGQHSLAVAARLADGATLSAAREELDGIAAELEALYPGDNEGRGMNAEPLRDVLFGNVQTPLLVLLASVALVLLIGCVNVANLLLARGASRAREVAVRSALGASTGRLARQFVVETLLLTLVAGAAGVLLAYASLDMLIALVPGSIPRLVSVGIDARVLGAVAGTLIVVGLAFGLVPTLQARRPDVRARLASTGDSGGRRARAGRRVRGGLVAAEVALAVVLVTSAGLLINSFWRLMSVDPGFNAEQLVKFDFILPASRYPQAIPDFPNYPEARAFYRDLQAEAGAVPGILGATIAVHHPLNPGWTTSYRLEGQTDEEAERQPEVVLRPVSHGYLETVGATLVRGRTVEASDDADAPPVALVNEALVRAHADDVDVLGRTLNFFGRDFTIIGVIADERFSGPAGETPRAVYPSLQQVPFTDASLLVRAGADPERVIPSVRRAFARLDPELAVYGVETLDETLGEAVAQPRFTMLLLSVFGALAMVLAAIGVHGVLAYSVERRTREIGIRMALGASQSEVVGLIIRQGMRPTLVGLGLGLAAALAAARLLESLLFGVQPTDAATYAAVMLALTIVALAACWLPARRAAGIEPISTLREE